MKTGRIFYSLLFLLALAVSPAFAQTEAEFTADFDGSVQKYIVILPDGFDADQPHDLVFYLHGHGSDRTQILSDLWEEIRAVRETALQKGAILVSPDYRAKTSWMGPAAEADMVQLISELKAQYKINRTIFTGGSMGGTGTLTFTALHPDLIDGALAMNPHANHFEYENFQDAIAESFGGDKKTVPLEYKKRSAEYFPEQFTMPLVITLGGQDTIVPPDAARRLAVIAAKLQPNVLVIDRPDMGHSTTYEDAVTALEYLFEKTAK